MLQVPWGWVVATKAGVVETKVSTDSRQRIVDAAEELFAEKGYHGASVREIVRRAEVTSPMLYYHFGSKEDLLAALLRERFDAFMANLREVLQEATSVSEVMERTAAFVFQAALERPAQTRFLVQTLLGPHDTLPIQAIHDQHFLLRPVLQEAFLKHDPTLDVARIRFTVELFHNALTGYLLQALTGLERSQLDEVPALLARLLLSALQDLGPAPQLSDPSLT